MAPCPLTISPSTVTNLRPTFLERSMASCIVLTIATLPSRYLNTPSYLSLYLTISQARPIYPPEDVTEGGRAALFPLMEAIGRKVKRPALLSLRAFMASLASLSFWHIIFCIDAPMAVSMATSKPLGTSMSSAATPSIPLSPLFITNLTAPLYPS